eukprot:UN04261
MAGLVQPSHTYNRIIPEFKIVVLGEGGVGKSSLTVRLCSDNFIDEYDPTVEDCYRKSANIDDCDVELEITDTAGQEEFCAMRDEWIREGEGYLLVYSINKPNSFEKLYEIRERILQTKDCESAPIVIAGNKCDLEEERQVLLSQLQNLGKSWDCPVFETSAKLKVNNVECFHECVRQIVRYQKLEQDGNEANDTKQNNHTIIQCNCCSCVIL